MDSGPRFVEEQRFGQRWVVLAVAVGALAGWLPLILLLAGDDADGTPLWLAWLLAIVVGIGLPLLFLLNRLRFEVWDDRVVIRYRPITTRTIAFADVTAVEAVDYRPMREYGGWGVKGWSRRKVAYNVSGHRGARLTLTDGRTVLLGSQRADELAAAIAGRLGTPSSPAA